VRIYPERALCCANASHARGGWPKCSGYWCHGCYRLEDDKYFPIRRPTDEDGYVVIVPRDRDRFMFGRAGDQLLTTFQCDTCHFRNINFRSPRPNGEDALLMKFIRRANLDALWSREPGTVNNTRRDLENLSTKAKILGIDEERMLPAMGPFPLTDVHGMGVAVCILLRSLDAGRNEETIQFSTATKMKSSFANMWRASIKGSTEAVVARDTVKLFHTTCPTHCDWFERFTKGMHERMGDLVKPDLAISIEQMHALMENYERRWEIVSDDSNAQQAVVFPALFSVVAFCCALRGEELPLLSLCGIRRHLERGRTHPTHPHVVVALLGRFKSEVSQKYHLMPIVLITKTGLEPGLWISRMVKWYEDKGIIRGWVFRNFKTGDAARASDYEWDILQELEKIQRDSPEILDGSVNVLEEYGVSRSFRRGSDTHALNQGVSITDIERNNRWRSVEHAGSKQVVLRMVHHYEEVSQMLKSLLRYSEPL
jgi:hypothetical protein